MAWKQLVVATDQSGFEKGQTVFVNLDNVEFVTPAGAGSRLFGASLTREGNLISIAVTASPATILAGESVG